MPENDFEVLATRCYLDETLIYYTEADLEKKLSFIDIHSETLDDVFSGTLNMYEFVPEVRVVGIVDCDSEQCTQASLLLTDSLFQRVQQKFYQEYAADSYEVCLTKKTRADGDIYNSLYTKEITLNLDAAGVIYDSKNGIDTNSWIFEMLLLVLVILLLLLFVLFFSFNVKDNHEKIGVLRALGVRNSDLLRIWVMEAMFICLITGIVSTIAEAIALKAYNASLCTKYLLSSSIYNMDARVELGELVCILVFALVAVVCPIWIMSDKKPIELMNKR